MRRLIPQLLSILAAASVAMALVAPLRADGGDGHEAKIPLAVRGLTVSPSAVSVGEHVTVAASVVNTSEHELTITVVPAAKNRRFEVVSSQPAFGPITLPPGARQDYEAVLVFEKRGATMVGLTAVGPVGFIDPVAKPLVVESGNERLVVQAVLLLVALAAVGLAFLARGVQASPRRMGGMRLLGFVSAGAAMVGLLVVKREVPQFVDPHNWSLFLLMASVAVLPASAMLLFNRRESISGVRNVGWFIAAAVIFAEEATTWAQYSPSVAGAIALGAVAVVSGVTLVGVALNIALFRNARPYVLVAAAAFWVLGEGWWIHAAVLKTLYGPDFVL